TARQTRVPKRPAHDPGRGWPARGIGVRGCGWAAAGELRARRPARGGGESPPTARVSHRLVGTVPISTAGPSTARVGHSGDTPDRVPAALSQPALSARGRHRDARGTVLFDRRGLAGLAPALQSE